MPGHPLKTTELPKVSDGRTQESTTLSVTGDISYVYGSDVPKALEPGQGEEKPAGATDTRAGNSSDVPKASVSKQEGTSGGRTGMCTIKNIFDPARSKRSETFSSTDTLVEAGVVPGDPADVPAAGTNVEHSYSIELADDPETVSGLICELPSMYTWRDNIVAERFIENQVLDIMVAQIEKLKLDSFPKESVEAGDFQKFQQIKTNQSKEEAKQALSDGEMPHLRNALDVPGPDSVKWMDYLTESRNRREHFQEVFGRFSATFLARQLADTQILGWIHTRLHQQQQYLFFAQFTNRSENMSPGNGVQQAMNGALGLAHNNFRVPEIASYKDISPDRHGPPTLVPVESSASLEDHMARWWSDLDNHVRQIKANDQERAQRNFQQIVKSIKSYQSGLPSDMGQIMLELAGQVEDSIKNNPALSLKEALNALPSTLSHDDPLRKRLESNPRRTRMNADLDGAYKKAHKLLLLDGKLAWTGADFHEELPPEAHRQWQTKEDANRSDQIRAAQIAISNSLQQYIKPSGDANPVDETVSTNLQKQRKHLQSLSLQPDAPAQAGLNKWQDFMYSTQTSFRDTLQKSKDALITDDTKAGTSATAHAKNVVFFQNSLALSNLLAVLSLLLSVSAIAVSVESAKGNIR